MQKLLVTVPEGDVLATFFPPAVRALLAEHFETDYNPLRRQYTQDELRTLLPGYDVVMTGWGTRMMDESVLSGNDRLRLIVHTGGTVGNLVDHYAYDHGIRVFSGNQLYAESVAEGTIGYMLLSQRRLPDYLGRTRVGAWRSEADIWEGLLDKKIGIIGVGTISNHLVRMLQVFHPSILVYSHYPMPDLWREQYHCRETSMEEIFSTCDIVTVHSALNQENRGLIGKKQFDLLRDNALFINTSRGDVLIEADLVEALKEKRFRAVLDVYHQEPLPEDSPLRTLPNVYAIPHMAGPTLDRRQMITTALVRETARFFEGETVFPLEITRELAARMTKM